MTPAENRSGLRREDVAVWIMAGFAACMSTDRSSVLMYDPAKDLRGDTQAVARHAAKTAVLWADMLIEELNKG